MAVELAHFKGGFQIAQCIPESLQVKTAVQSYAPRIARRLPVGRYDLAPTTVEGTTYRHTLVVFSNTDQGEYSTAIVEEPKDLVVPPSKKPALYQTTVAKDAHPVILLDEKDGRQRIMYVIYYRPGINPHEDPVSSLHYKRS